MTEIDAAELARLREVSTKAFIVAFRDERGRYLGDISAKTLLALLDTLEKARGDLITMSEAESERNSARALLREALPWVGHMSDNPDAGLRARIDKEIG